MDDSTYNILAALNFPEHMLKMDAGGGEGSSGQNTGAGFSSINAEGSRQQSGDEGDVLSSSPLSSLIQSALNGGEGGSSQTSTEDASTSAKRRKYARRFSIGRKKTNPVWDYYDDLRTPTDPDGPFGVKCKQCDFYTEDRAPSNLKSHIRRNHPVAFVELKMKWAEMGRPDSDEEIVASSHLTDKDCMVTLAAVVGESSMGTTGTVSGHLRHAMCKDWVKVGVFYTEAELITARAKGKVSKRRTEHLKSGGTKIRYRCGTWRRTKCPYQMYTFHHEDRWELYECGQHTHNTHVVNPSITYRVKSEKVEGDFSHELSRSLENPYDSDQLSSENLLQSILQQAMNSQEALDSLDESPMVVPKLNRPVALGLKSAEGKISSNTAPYQQQASDLDNVEWSLSDEAKIAELSQVAAELDLVFSRVQQYHKGTPESFLLFATAPIAGSNESDRRSLTLSDGDVCVALVQKFNEETVAREQWRKADWRQFLYAVRGLLAQAMMKQDGKELTREEMRRIKTGEDGTS